MSVLTEADRGPGISIRRVILFLIGGALFFVHVRRSMRSRRWQLKGLIWINNPGCVTVMICPFRHRWTDVMPANEYSVAAWRVDANGSVARCKDAEVLLDTALPGRADAFNPAELFLAAIAACMIKGIERVTPMLKFRLQGVAVRLTGRRQDAPPKMTGVEYELWIETDEPQRRLDLLHHNVRNFGTIFNTVLAACPLEGAIHRGIPPWRQEATRGTDSLEARA